MSPMGMLRTIVMQVELGIFFDVDYYNKSGKTLISACIDGGVCTWDAFIKRCN